MAENFNLLKTEQSMCASIVQTIKFKLNTFNLNIRHAGSSDSSSNRPKFTQSQEKGVATVVGATSSEGFRFTNMTFWKRR